MSDFINFLKKDEQKKMTEEERLINHKKQKQIAETIYDVDEFDDEFDDEFYEDDELNEAHRVIGKPAQPIRKVQNKPNHQIQKPIIYEEPYNEFNDIARSEITPVRRVRRQSVESKPPVNESYNIKLNPALNEAYNLIDEMKNKMEMMFFKYGMTGLEKLNNCMLDMCDQIMNPHNIDEKINQSSIKSQIKRKMPMVKPTTKVVKSVNISEKNNKEIEEQILDNNKDLTKTQTNNINEMFENIDLNDIGNTLVMQSDVQENNASKCLANIEARAKKLTEKTNKNDKLIVETDNKIDENINNTLEIVPDGTNTIDIENIDINLENTEFAIPTEENEEK